MKRTAFALLCFSLIFSAAWAADPVPPSPTDTYILARDRYIAAFKNLPDRGRGDSRAAEALAGVDRLLRAAVPAWTASGFPATGEMNLNCMDDNDMGFSVPDGLAYRAGGTSVIVTNRALLLGWQARHNTEYRTHVPVAIPAAFRDETFWTFAASCDAGAYIHGTVPVRVGEGADSVTVALGGFHNGLDYDATPDELLAAVVRGDRVWIATETLKQPLAPFTGCVNAYKRGSDEYPFAPTVQQSARLHDQAMADAVTNYQACFARELRKRPAYAAVQKQAQDLVDLLR